MPLTGQITRRRRSGSVKMAGYKILQAEKQGIYVLKFIGEIRLNLCSTMDNLVETTTGNPQFKTVLIDLTETEIIDSTTLGLLGKIALAARKQSRFLPTLISTNPDITRIITSMGFDKIFIIVREPASRSEERRVGKECRARGSRDH